MAGRCVPDERLLLSSSAAAAAAPQRLCGEPLVPSLPALVVCVADDNARLFSRSPLPEAALLLLTWVTQDCMLLPLLVLAFSSTSMLFLEFGCEPPLSA